MMIDLYVYYIQICDILWEVLLIYEMVKFRKIQTLKYFCFTFFLFLMLKQNKSDATFDKQSFLLIPISRCITASF